MPKRRGPSPFTIVVYLLVIIIFLKLLRIIPGSPEYETFSIVLGIVGVALTIIVSFQEWMRSKFGKLEDSIEELTQLFHSFDKRFTVLETRMESLQLVERVAKLEERLKEGKK